MDISNRKQRILAQIVALHTSSGDPVGSRLLQEFLDTVSVSTATLRSEMAQLTALGLLEQPHTSAGRVPTVEGYRYFLNNLMTAKPLSAAEKRAIQSAVDSMDPDPDRAAQAAAEHLAKLSGLGAITTTPVCADTQMIHFELVRVGRYNTAVLGITNLGVLDVKTQYGDYRITNMIGIPPHVSATRRVISVYTYNGKMTITDTKVKKI